MTTAPAGPAVAAGTLLGGRFRVVRFLARGGMGEVYEAEDAELGGLVALKLIRPEIAADEDALRRFRREIRLARKVTHPNVCRVFDIVHDTVEGGPERVFLTMELLGGETLAARLRRDGRFAADDALPVARQIAAALAHAHRAGVVHRDLKCENVFLVPEGKGQRAVVTDFGLAVGHRHGDADDTVTHTQALAGTPAYMAPEQLAGYDATPASDIYALGLVLYEMVTGKRPFGSDGISSAMRRMVEDPPSPRSAVPGIPPRWERTILRCLKRDPARRPASADEVMESLEGHAVPWRGGLRRRRAAALTAAVVVGIVAAGTLLWQPWRGHREARPSLAVLAPTNLSAHPEDQWLSTAMAEMLGTELAATEHLRVAAGESVARARSDLQLQGSRGPSPETLKRLGTLLGVRFIVSGAFVKLDDGHGPTLRLDLRLQDARSGELHATFSDTVPAGNLLPLVARAATEVEKALGTVPQATGTTLQQALPTDAGAARLYAEGLQALRGFDATAARPLLEAAVAAEPANPLPHAALADALADLGYDARAADEARRAADLARKLPRELRLAIEARQHATAHEWSQAVEIYRSLWTFYPDSKEWGIDLARALVHGGRPAEAMAVVERLRAQSGQSSDPAVDLVAAEAAEGAAQVPQQLELARRCAQRARDLGARLLLARARQLEGEALWAGGDQDGAQAAWEEARSLYSAAGDRRGVATVLLALANALRDHGQRVEAEKTAGRALAIFQTIGDQAGAADALRSLGDLDVIQGRLDEGRALLERSLAVAREAGNARSEASSLRTLAWALRRRGDLDGARTLYEQALAAWNRAGDQRGAATALVSLAILERQKGDPKGAVTRLRQALTIRRRLGDRRGEVVPLVNLGNNLLEIGDLVGSNAAFRQALDLARELGSKRPEGYALFGLGEVAKARDDLAAARSFHRQALTLREEDGERPAAAASRLALAMVEIEDRAYPRAADLARAMLAPGGSAAAPDLESYAQGVAALAYLGLGDAAAARAAAQRAEDLAAAGEDRSARLFAATIAGRVALATGDTDRARELLTWAMREAASSEVFDVRVQAMLDLARAEAATDPEGARRRLHEARTLAAGAGYRLLERKIDTALADLG